MRELLFTDEDDWDLDDDAEDFDDADDLGPDPINALERRIALYASEVRLRPQMRRKHAALDDALAAGLDALGSDGLVELAATFVLLADHADHYSGARAQLRRLWPDRERWKLAGQLAESPIWDQR
jgi:hypothetical protein